MFIKITLAFALVIAALATIPGSAGPRNGGQAAFSYGDNPTAIGGASGGGNLVPLW
jgi:hypothetical protein